MEDRLKQIWAGFEERTSRHLVEGGVDNIVVPHRSDWKAELEPPPEGLDAPAEAAFSALKMRLKAQAKKAKKGARSFEPIGEAPSFAMADPSEAARDLIRGLKSTEMRVSRPQYNYEDALPDGARRKLFKKRKKFLGIF